MKLITTLTRGAVLGLCVGAFTATALADPGNGNGNGPATTPPGQEKKAEPAAPAPAPAAAPAPAPAPAAQAAKGQEQKAENQEQKAEKKQAVAAKKAAPKPVSASASKGQAKKAEKQAEHKPAKAESESRGQSADAHHHVIICHRTGSTSNPYVVINIPWTAWTNGHTTHPAKNGNADKILKDPASRPGSKDGFTKADCGAAVTQSVKKETKTETKQEIKTGNCPTTVTTTERVVVGIWHATGATKNGERKFVLIHPSKMSAHWKGKHEDDFEATELRTVTRTVSGENCASVTANAPAPPAAPAAPAGPAVEQAQPVVVGAPANAPLVPGAIGVLPAAPAAPENVAAPVGGVAGVVAPAPTAQPESAGGVLGAIASAPEAVADTATAATLPFTGFPLWIVALIGVVLLLTGLVLRRRNTSLT